MTDKVPNRPAAQQGLNFSLPDIYYILFRHKGKIVVLFGFGLILALLLPLVWRLPYQSEAKLFIRYVLESRSPGQPASTDARVKSPDERGETVINTELEIISSLDIALQVADAIGPQKLLSRIDGGTNRIAAAALIHRNLIADASKKSSVIHLIFQHPDPELVQPVLNQLIGIYLTKHAEVHRVGVVDDSFNRETDELRNRLQITREELRKAKETAGVLSIEDSKKVFTEQNSKIQQAIYDAEAELAERLAAFKEISKNFPAALPIATTNVLATNLPAGSDSIAEYRQVCSILDSLDKKEQLLLSEFTPQNSLVKPVHEQIEAYRSNKKQLETEHPDLLTLALAQPKSGESAAGTHLDLSSEAAKVTALEAKIKVLNIQLATIRTNAVALDLAETTIAELELRKEREETRYKSFATSREQALIDDALGSGRVSGISRVQDPSAPFRDRAKLQKVQIFILLGTLAAAFGLGLLIEIYIDRSVRRPAEIEGRVGLPLFLSIPLIGSDHKRGFVSKLRRLPLFRRSTHSALRIPPSALSAGHQPSTIDSIAEPSHYSALRSPQSALPLAPFFDALRDRLISFFEIKNLTHKPKLVAITSCGEGSGVSTVASGLAASLSETGDGNVLLVDMNQPDGSVHQFQHGRPSLGLDAALEIESRDAALVQNKLYMVSEFAVANLHVNGNGAKDGHNGNGGSIPEASAESSDVEQASPDHHEVAAGQPNGNGNGHGPPHVNGHGYSGNSARVLPKRFNALVPKLKASDYDYIIFDMPPISQISITPRIAKHMDMVLVVVESEKTEIDVLKRAAAFLSESKPNLGAILNKRRTYVPKVLQQEL
jgi:Mrp family chromosome partitioning ATPase/uncharacterized protein involved in exopolysaccharide biosynthesis